MNRLKVIWHASRAVAIKKKLHTLDMYKDEAKVDKLRRKREKHINALLAVNGPSSIRDSAWSHALDDEEPMVQILPTMYDYDENGEDTGKWNKNL